MTLTSEERNRLIQQIDDGDLLVVDTILALARSGSADQEGIDQFLRCWRQVFDLFKPERRMNRQPD